MKILVTGGTGRIGANLVKGLLAKRYEIRSFVYPGDRSRAHKLDGFERVETVEGDLRNLEDVKRAVEGVDAIYHLAAAFTGPFDHTEFLAINAMGTINLLECIRTGLPNLHRFVYASTEAIYWKATERGYCFDEPITEDRVARYHQMPYFLTKWIGEELAMTYHHQYGVPTTVFRFSTVIEPSEFLNDDGLPPIFLLSRAVESHKNFRPVDSEEEEMVRTLLSLCDGKEKLLLSRAPDGRPLRGNIAMSAISCRVWSSGLRERRRSVRSSPFPAPPSFAGMRLFPTLPNAIRLITWRPGSHLRFTTNSI